MPNNSGQDKRLEFFLYEKCWGRFLVEAAPTLSRQYHGSCLLKAVKAECY